MWREWNITAVEEQFRLFENGRAGIESSSLGTVLRAVGLNPTQATVQQHQRAFEGEGRAGSISWAQFQPIYSAVKAMKQEGSKDEFVEALRVFDKDGNGQISIAELRSVLTGLGEKLTEDEVMTLLRNCPTSNDFVNYETFVKMVMEG